MHIIEIPDRKIRKVIASDWSELKPKDYLFACKNLFLVIAQQISPDVFKKLMVDRLLNRKNLKDKPDIESDNGLDYWEIETKLSKLMNFFFVEHGKQGEKDHKIEINTKFCCNKIKKLRLFWGMKTLYGPEDLLFNMTFGEFVYCMNCLKEFNTTKEEVWMNRLCAAMYRPAKKFWRIRKFLGFITEKRIAFDDAKLNKRVNMFRFVDFGKRFGIMLFFSGCVTWISTECIRINGDNFFLGKLFLGGKEPNKDETVITTATNTGLTGVLFSLAESGVFGDTEKTAKANLFDVLLRLYQLDKQNEELNRKMK